MAGNVFLAERRLEHGDRDLVDGLFTVGGVASAATALLAVLAVGGAVGWNLVEPSPDGSARFPGWLLAAVLVGLGLLVVAYLRPRWARVVGPVYALVEGLVVGAVAHAYEVAFDGIALHAALLTGAVFAVMLFLFGSGLVTVTGRMRRIVTTATAAIMVTYLVQLLLWVSGVDLEVPFLHDSGPIGIGVSLLIVGVASFNYLLDFDLVVEARDRGAPRDVEWVAALGLLVTTVWLYLELLRLLAKFRD